MPAWLRIVLAIVAGFVVWFAVATVGDLAIRRLLPGYTEVEKAMDFSSGMPAARLVLGALASLVAGAACAVIGRSARAATCLFALLLLALFVPGHVSLWVKFPVGYHVVFLGSLAPLVVLGGKWLSAPGTSAG